MLFRYICILIVIIFTSCTKIEQVNNVYYDSIIRNYKSTGKIEKYNHGSHKEYKVIEDVLTALEHLKYNDSINAVSTALFSESIATVEQTNNIALSKWVYSEVGFYYYSYGYYLQASTYFIKISKIIDSDPSLLTIQESTILLRSAYFFETMEKYDKCIAYYNKALEASNKQVVNNSAILSSLGYVYLKVDSLEKASMYFTLASEKALQYGDTLRYAKTLGGLAAVYHKQGNTDKAISYYNTDIQVSKQLNEEINVMYGLIQLGKLYFDINDLELAEQCWKQADAIAKSKSYLIGFQSDIADHLLELAQIQNSFKDELYYRRELAKIELLKHNKEGDNVINEVNWNTNLARINWELEAEKNTLEQIQYQRLFLVTGIALLLVLIIVIFVFHKRIVKLQTFKYEAKLLDFQLAKANSEHKLKETHTSLAAYKVYLSEKTEQISQLEKALTTMKTSSAKFSKEQRPDLEELLHSHLMTDENWHLFKITFQEEQKQYMEYLNTHYPDLTESNLRIVLLQKMGLKNQEVANILGVTIDAIKKAKQRLKKKYEDKFDALFIDQTA